MENVDYKQYSLDELNIGININLTNETLPVVLEDILKVIANEFMCIKTIN